MLKSKFTLAVASVVSALSIGVITQVAEAANWLMLQGTETPGAVGRAEVWGFVQAEATYLDATKVPAAAWKGSDMAPNTVGPDRSSRATMNIRRARIGVRGQGFPLDNKVNYFLLTEFGHNEITVPGGGAYLTDASVTLNHVPFARLRIGQFKTPGSEEGLQAIHAFDYVNFTNGTDQLLMERFANGDGSSTTDDLIAGTKPGTYVNKSNGGVGAFRDTGVQLFDTIKMKNIEISYAGMIGNGNGINRQDNNGKKDIYGYLSVEQVYGGKGARRDGVKAYVWAHKGKRTLTEEKPGVYNRDRSGVGATFRKGAYRAGFEYMTASGLIRNGTDGGATIESKSLNGVNASLNYLLDGKANAYYADFGYKLMKNLELDLRYDVLNRGVDNNNAERTFTTTTLGAQYFLNKKTRIIVNYEMRSMEVPNVITHPTLVDAAAAINKAENTNAKGIDGRASIQLLAIF